MNKYAENVVLLCALSLMAGLIIGLVVGHIVGWIDGQRELHKRLKAVPKSWDKR